MPGPFDAGQEPIRHFVLVMSAIERIYECGFELVADDFEELTPDVYEAAWKGGFPKELKLFRTRELTLLQHGENAAELLVCDDEERGAFLDAGAFINREAAKAPVALATFKERLFNMAKNLPKYQTTRAGDAQPREPAEPADVIPLDPRPSWHNRCMSRYALNENPSSTCCSS